jgi:hypothetical protein
VRVKSGGVDEDEFGVLFHRDVDIGLIDGGNAVADCNPLPVDEDHALGGWPFVSGMVMALKRRRD